MCRASYMMALVIVTAPAPSSEELGVRTHNIPYFVTLVGPNPLKSADLAGYLRGENPDYDPAPIVSAFNLIVMAHAAHTGFRALTKDAYYFDPNADTGVPTRPSIKVINSFFASVRPVHKSLIVSVNTCMSMFHVLRSMANALREFMQQSRSAVPQKFFGNMRIVTSYLRYNRRNTVKVIGPGMARWTKIQSEKFGNITVEEYFQKKFHITLCYADDLPVVNVGKEGKDIFVPAELSKIVPGTLFTSELKSGESAALCAANNKMPAGYTQTITIKGLCLLGFEEGTPPIASFRIKILTNMAVVTACVLPAPLMVHGIQFARLAELKHLAVVVLKDGNIEESDSLLKVQVREAVKALIRKCHARGMNVNLDFIMQVLQLHHLSREDPYHDEDVDKVSRLFESLPGRPQIVLALMSNKNKHIYVGLHRYFDVGQDFQSVISLIENMLDKEGHD
ncbi:Piwi-domain-containing protein [Sanghuangporus baumii]|uniref:Piwi-domain-containing protein n=1 Tax=Sanghuangporus baumii TaxID=108892 RepID=A0A9Q5I5X5_SANBA|nr:Piwi-domain-containing protein [Sanghuangporus baumii]